MRVNPMVYGTVVVGLFLGTIWISQAAGFWSVSGKVTPTGEAVRPTGTNVDEIKGWMTLGEIATAYCVPASEILVAFGLPSDTPADRQIKELESETFSPAELRTWLRKKLTTTQAPSP